MSKEWCVSFYVSGYKNFYNVLINPCELQGLKNFNKAARDLVQRLQKIDGDNYPEVRFTFFFLLICEKLCNHIILRSNYRIVL